MLTCNHKDGTIIVDIERILRRRDLAVFYCCSGFQIYRNQGGKRAFEWSCIVRAVCSIDVITATVAEIPHELMVHITERITHEVPGINRVLYDFTPKPTGTVEFE